MQRGLGLWLNPLPAGNGPRQSPTIPFLGTWPPRIITSPAETIGRLEKRWHDSHMSQPKHKEGKNLQMGAAILLVLFSISLGLLGQATPNACTGKKLPRFDDYAAPTAYDGKPRAPILATRLDRKYQTTIKNAVDKGVNFAWHFAVAMWGCGSGCQEFVIVDLRTGAVYDPSFDEVDFHYGPKEYDPGWQCYSDLLTYRRDSSLLVVEGCLRGKQCGRTYLIMESGRLKQIAYDPDRLRDGTVAPF
jgi:hypothetical protein